MRPLPWRRTPCYQQQLVGMQGMVSAPTPQPRHCWATRALGAVHSKGDWENFPARRLKACQLQPYGHASRCWVEGLFLPCFNLTTSFHLVVPRLVKNPSKLQAPRQRRKIVPRGRFSLQLELGVGPIPKMMIRQQLSRISLLCCRQSLHKMADGHNPMATHAALER